MCERTQAELTVTLVTVDANGHRNLSSGVQARTAIGVEIQQLLGAYGSAVSDPCGNCFAIQIHYSPAYERLATTSTRGWRFVCRTVVNQNRHQPHQCLSDCYSWIRFLLHRPTELVHGVR